jgi:hypothetical protein
MLARLPRQLDHRKEVAEGHKPPRMTDPRAPQHDVAGVLPIGRGGTIGAGTEVAPEDPLWPLSAD